MKNEKRIGRAEYAVARPAIRGRVIMRETRDSGAKASSRYVATDWSKNG